MQELLESQIHYVPSLQPQNSLFEYYKENITPYIIKTLGSCESTLYQFSQSTFCVSKYTAALVLGMCILQYQSHKSEAKTTSSLEKRIRLEQTARKSFIPKPEDYKRKTLH